jgi:PKD repeat protein/streptogramin lyase
MLNNRIQKFTSSWAHLATWGSYGSGNGQFDSPWGIAVDASGNIYVADYGNYRIRKLGPSGSNLPSWGTPGGGEGQFEWPTGVAVDSLDNVYVIDSGNNRIQKFTSSGAHIATWGSSGREPGLFEVPVGIAVDASGNVYVADGSNCRIQMLDSNGVPLAMWGTDGAGDGEFVMPNAVAVDNRGYVYVADGGNHRIQKFTSLGGFITVWNSTQPGNPEGIAVDASANVYVSYAGNHNIQIFAQQGVSPPEHHPDIPADPKQLKSDEKTEIGIGSKTNERTVIFQEKVSDSQGHQVRLQVELRNLDEYDGQFKEQAGQFKTGGLVPSGSYATATADELNDENYHWRARTVDEQGHASEWREFGRNDISEPDFVVDTTPPQSPIADFTFSQEKPLIVDFDASSSQGDDLTYYWYFGENLQETFSSKNPKIPHEYSSPGPYIVQLWVVDTHGTSSEHIFKEVQVSDEWSFAIITDLHIGFGYPDYGGDSFDGTGKTDYFLTDRLEKVVDTINKENQDKKNIHFVVILGDIADSAEKSEFLKAQEILNKLNVPYIPLLGNHDVYPYTQKGIWPSNYDPDKRFDPFEPDKYIDQQWGKIDKLEQYFDDTFWRDNENNHNLQELKKLFGDWNPQFNVYKVLDGESINAKLENYAFEYGGTKFIALDFVKREKGSDLPKYYSETDSWLRENLRFSGPIILLSHHPLLTDELDFTLNDFNAIQKAIHENGNGNIVHFAGHNHRNRDVIIGKMAGTNHEISTEAVLQESWVSEKTGNFIRIVKMNSNGIVSYDNYKDIIENSNLPPASYFTHSVEYPKIGSNIYVQFYPYPFDPNDHVSSCQFDWDFNDRTSLSSTNANRDVPIVHTYQSNGNYDVKLTTTNEGGSSDYIQNINVDGSPAWAIISHTPNFLKVTNPYGMSIAEPSQQIGGMGYFQTDIDGDGIIENIVYVTHSVNGDYLIRIIPDIKDTPFSLALQAGDETITLAENEPISKLPNEPYKIHVQVDENNNVQIYPGEWAVIANSPVNLKVTNPEGTTIEKSSGQIGGMIYLTTDIDNDNEIEDTVAVMQSMTGDYLVSVVPKDGAQPTDTYSLAVQNADRMIPLADNIQVGEIPNEPYKIQVDENNNVNVIPSEGQVPVPEFPSVMVPIILVSGLAVAVIYIKMIK